MTRLLHIDAIAGVAGDMLLGALIDAGASEERVRDGLKPLGVDIVVTRTERHGIGAARLEVLTADERVHRDWAAVRALIDAADLPTRAHAGAHDAFRRLAEAEGAIHGVPPDDVHFHEVGAIDALADVCGVALALEDLDVDEISCSPLPAPRGFVDAAHGRLPLPAPATLELLKGVPLEGVDIATELVTPTGAALVAALATTYGPLPPMILESTGYGAGTRDLHDRPNLVRVILGVTKDAPARRPAVLLACNLDDLSPELVPDAASACTDAGALDVWIAPVQMKKGRPGMVLSAVARPDREAAVAEAMLRSTSTLGVRTTALHRYELDRELRTVTVEGHPVGVKLGRLRGEIVNVAPEHDDVAEAAAALGRPVKAIWGAAWAAAQREIDVRA